MSSRSLALGFSLLAGLAALPGCGAAPDEAEGAEVGAAQEPGQPASDHARIASTMISPAGSSRSSSRALRAGSSRPRKSRLASLGFRMCL